MALAMIELIDQAKQLPAVNLKAATAYQKNSASLTKYVDDSLASEQSILLLIGHNPLQVMYDNHKHHAAFMATVFSISSHELLAKTVPWVYRAYHAHGFSYDYFLLELKAWACANAKFLDGGDAAAINAIYAWLIAVHEQMVLLSEEDASLSLPISEDWIEVKNSFRSSLLQGDHKRCLALADESIKSSADIESFYLHIIQPVMYEVGMLWERAEISIAHEHLASAIIGRIMATINATKNSSLKRRGKAVVTASPNEFHELGAWMISDVLEREGWEVQYLGANMPQVDLISLLKSFKPDILAMSVTIPFNVEKAKNVIAEIKSDAALAGIKVMIGGRVFNETPELWRVAGADGFAPNLQDARQLAESWRSSAN